MHFRSPTDIGLNADDFTAFSCKRPIMPCWNMYLDYRVLWKMSGLQFLIGRRNIVCI